MGGIGGKGGRKPVFGVTDRRIRGDRARVKRQTNKPADTDKRNGIMN